MRRRNQHGMALVITLLVITLLSIIVMEFTFSTQVNSHLTRNALNATQAHYLARSAVVLAEAALRRDLEDKQTPEAPQPFADSLLDRWAQPLPPLDVAEGFGTVAYRITDEASRFNLNALADPTAKPDRKEMLKQLVQGILGFVGLDKDLIHPLVDWIDLDDMVATESGAESEYYLGLRPPYFPRNGLLLSVDELVLVKGFESLTPNEWRALHDIFSVDTGTDLGVNPNTASALLLTAVFTFYGVPELAEAILEERTLTPFRQSADLERLPGWSQLHTEIRSVFSKFRGDQFTIHATGNAGGIDRGLDVTVRRGERPTGTFAVVRWRETSGQQALTSAEAPDGIPDRPL